VSIQAVAWVLDHSEATLADRLVLIAIANHVDGKGWNAWPAIGRIASEARVDRRTVFRAIETLETAGELTVERRTGRSSIYGITAIMGWQDVTPQGVTGQ
jgi:DNA-binding MarR family transcriptional regulator